MVTPLTQRYFGFGELANSLMYSLCGVEVILGFFFLRWLSRRVADRAMLAVGLVICCVACIWCLVFLCNPRGANLSEKTYKHAHATDGGHRLPRASRSAPESRLCGRCRGAILGYTLNELSK